LYTLLHGEGLFVIPLWLGFIAGLAYLLVLVVKRLVKK